MEEPLKRSTTIVTVVSNLLILVGFCVIGYFIFFTFPKQKARTMDTLQSISNLAESIKIYSNEPGTVKVLSEEIIRNVEAHAEKLKKEDYSPNVRR